MTEPHLGELVKPGAHPDSPVFNKMRPIYWVDKSPSIQRGMRWKDSATLRRAWARTFLLVKEINVQRLYDATNVDAIDEGMLTLSDEWVWRNFLDYSRKLEAWHAGGKIGTPPVGPSPRERLFAYLRGCYNPDTIDIN